MLLQNRWKRSLLPFILGMSVFAFAFNDSNKEERDSLTVTHHEALIAGQKIAYSAHTGTYVLREEDGTPKGKIFFMAYVRKGVKDLAKRPLTFSFNGGPGSSSVWLHLGVLGPRRVKMDENGNPYPPPYELVNNEYSLLDKTDLVFIDPVSTGFSRAVAGEDASQFHGFQEDIESVGAFIRRYISRNDRWASPKFLVGESYGTTRAAGLAGHLQRRHGVFLNGIMLVSSILNFQTARFNAGNDLPYILFLPTYTATAWYHKQLSDDYQADLNQTLKKAEEFARGDYASALMLGDRLQGAEREKIAQKLSALTGLSVEYLQQTNLRINIRRFVKELMRKTGRTVGRLDSRFLGFDRDDAGENYDYDPSYSAIQGPYTATLNHYVRTELGYKTDLDYEILSGRVRPWSYKQFENRYVDVSETLRQTMSQNPDLKIYVANGYYDLATPYFATLYTFDHLGLKKELRDNISMGFFEAGHMMYIHIPSLIALKKDLDGFIERSVP